jgi:hypothetical protein
MLAFAGRGTKFDRGYGRTTLRNEDRDGGRDDRGVISYLGEADFGSG